MKEAGSQPLARLLVTGGLVTEEALEEILAVQKSQGRRLGELLAEKGLVRPHQLAQFLSHQLSCPWVSLQRVEISLDAVEVLPRRLALKHHMVPVHLRTSKGATVLYVAMDDPTDEAALAAAAEASRLPVKPMVALSSEIQEHLDRLYGRSVRPSATATTPKPAAASTTPQPGRTSTSISPPSPTRPPKPPPPRAPSTPPERPEPSILSALDVIEVPPSSRPKPTAKVLVIGDVGEPAFERFKESVSASAERYGGAVIAITLAEASQAVSDYGPCAFVVTESTSERERADLDRLALESGALLIVSNAAFAGRHFEALLEGAIKRRRRSAYEKGAVLEGRYELLRDVGGAIAGSRWEVLHRWTGRRAIMKVGVRVPDITTGEPDEADAEAVRREHTALSRIQHPGAIDLLDAGITELGDPFVVVELFEGKTLEGLVAARGALPPAEGSALIRQIADVLVAAHEAGVRHGDVRPEHVLVVRDGGVERAKLVNWEKATTTESGGEVDDLAGIGNCAFLALAGRSRSEGEGVRAIRTGRWANQNLPPELASVIARTLPGAGADRFTSLRELSEALAGTNWEKAATELLEAKPERRGSVRPAAASLRPIPAAEGPPSKVPDVREMRRHPRAAYRTPVRVEVPGVGAVDGRSEDISERGLFVVTRGKVASDVQVTVRFALPIDGRIVSEVGVVRWSRAPSAGDSSGAARAIGIELTSPGEETVRQISRYVSFMAAER